MHKKSLIPENLLEKKSLLMNSINLLNIKEVLMGFEMSL